MGDFALVVLRFDPDAVSEGDVLNYSNEIGIRNPTQNRSMGLLWGIAKGSFPGFMVEYSHEKIQTLSVREHINKESDDDFSV